MQLWTEQIMKNLEEKILYFEYMSSLLPFSFNIVSMAFQTLEKLGEEEQGHAFVCVCSLWDFFSSSLLLFLIF